MAAKTKQKAAPNDSTPFEGSLALFAKEADKRTERVHPYRLDIGHGRKITFHEPNKMGTREFVSIFGTGGLRQMIDEQAVGVFLDMFLDEEDRQAYLATNPSIEVTVLVMEAVNSHYEDQVPTPGESDASSS